MRRNLFTPLILLFLCSCPGRRDEPLDLLVIDTVSGSIVERWAAPRHTFDVKVDPSTGRVWAMSEQDEPSLWELYPMEDPRRVYMLGSTEAYPFGSTLVEDYWFDRGAIAIDPIRRRIAFSSPRSSRTVLMDLDTEQVVSQQATGPLWHSISFDTTSDIAYFTGNLDLYSFRISDGASLDDRLCFGPENADWANNTMSVVVSEGGRQLFAINSETFLCRLALDGTSSAPTFAVIDCGVVLCSAAGMAVDDAATRLYIANTALFASFPADPYERLPSLTFWDLVANTQTTVSAPAMPHGLALTPDGQTLFVSHFFCNRIGVYDALNTNHLYDIRTDGRSWGMDFSADGSRLFVTQFQPNESDRVGDYGPGGPKECPPFLER